MPTRARDGELPGIPEEPKSNIAVIELEKGCQVISMNRASKSCFLQGALLAFFGLPAAGCARTPKAETHEASASEPAPQSPKPKENSAVDVGKAIANAAEAAKSGNLGLAHSLVRQALVVEPTNRQALGMLAQIAQRQAELSVRPGSSAFYVESGEAVRRLIEAHKNLSKEERTLAGPALYNEGCTQAIQGEYGRALASIATAYNLGFTRIDLLDNDEELDSLRPLPEFKAMQRNIERAFVDSTLARSNSRTLSVRFFASEPRWKRRQARRLSREGDCH